MRIDHIAIATPNIERTVAEVVTARGGRLAKWDPRPDAPFSASQYRFADAARLEVIGPNPAVPGDTFVEAFLARRGAGVHHMTIMVDDLQEAIDRMAAADFDVIDIDRSEPLWHEAFLRPGQVGGLVVQLVHEPYPDAPARAAGTYVEVTDDPARPRFVGVVLNHTDLDRARHVWTTLGACVNPDGDGLRCSWPDAPLTVFVRAGERAGPTHLVFDGGGHRDADDIGPAIVDVTPDSVADSVADSVDDSVDG